MVFLAAIALAAVPLQAQQVVEQIGFQDATTDNSDEKFSFVASPSSLPSGGGVAQTIGLHERNGLSYPRLDALCHWLGPQAWKLRLRIRLVEVFAGHFARLSKRCERLGHPVISVGRAHGQEFGSPQASKLLRDLIVYTEPEDVWFA